MTPEQWGYWAAEVAEAQLSAETDTFSALTVAVDKIIKAAREYVRCVESGCTKTGGRSAYDDLLAAVGGYADA